MTDSDTITTWKLTDKQLVALRGIITREIYGFVRIDQILFMDTGTIRIIYFTDISGEDDVFGVRTGRWDKKIKDVTNKEK